MGHVRPFGVILVGDGEGRTGHAAGVAEPVQHAARKRGLSRTEVAGKRDHITGMQALRPPRPQRLSLLGRMGDIFHGNTFSLIYIIYVIIYTIISRKKQKHKSGTDDVP